MWAAGYIRQFLLVAFSETVREASYTRNGEFKMYRMPEEQRVQFRPDVFGMFLRKLKRNFTGLRRFAVAVPQRRARPHLQFQFGFQHPRPRRAAGQRGYCRHLAALRRFRHHSGVWAILPTRQRVDGA